MMMKMMAIIGWQNMQNYVFGSLKTHRMTEHRQKRRVETNKNKTKKKTVCALHMCFTAVAAAAASSSMRSSLFRTNFYANKISLRQQQHQL